MVRIVYNLNKHDTNFEDLTATACLYQKGDSMCVFDLENQYIHIRLSEEAKQFSDVQCSKKTDQRQRITSTSWCTGSRWPDQWSHIGSNPCKVVCTSYNRGIRSAIYMDDGQVVASTAEKTREAMELTVQVFQKAGWNKQATIMQ